MAERPILGYLVPQFPGQTHDFFWREVREIEGRGWDVALISTRRPPAGLIVHDWSGGAMARTTYLGRPAMRDLGALPRLPWREILAERNLGWLRDVGVAGPAASALIRVCRARGIGHVHVHSCGRAALIAALARRMGGPRYSLTLHGPLTDYGPGQAFKWRDAAFATVITEKLMASVRDTLAGSLPERLIVQPMGVDTEAFRPGRDYTPVGPGETLRLFTCGRLNPVKGHNDLIEAVGMLVAAGRDVTLSIAGEDDAGGGGYRRVLETSIADRDLGDRVSLLGAMDVDQVRARLQDAHIFALASLHEALGVALMEAMSSGVPTIGTAAGGVAELIADGRDGVLVPPGDAGALADAIGALADDPDRAIRLGRAGRARVVEGFGAGRGAQTLIDAVGHSGAP